MVGGEGHDGVGRAGRWSNDINDGIRSEELTAGHTAEQLAKRMAVAFLRAGGRQPAPLPFPARPGFAHQPGTFHDGKRPAPCKAAPQGSPSGRLPGRILWPARTTSGSDG